MRNFSQSLNLLFKCLTKRKGNFFFFYRIQGKIIIIIIKKKVNFFFFWGGGGKKNTSPQKTFFLQHYRGLKLVDGNDNEWELNQLLFADDTVVVADSGRKLCQLVTEFGRVCERRKLRVNVGKSKVMKCTRNEDGARLNVMLNGEALEEVDQFKYLGSVIAANGGVEADVRHRVNEGCKVLGALKGVMKNRGLGMNVKKFCMRKWLYRL